MNKGFVYSDLFQLLPQSEKVSKLDFVEGGRTPAYSSDTSNNGCLGFVNKEPLFKVSDDRPVYLIFGDHTKTMNIVHNDFCVMDNVKVLIPKVSMTDEILFYVTTVWKKAIPHLGYARHWSKAQRVLIQLPVIENSNPNHEYTIDEVDWQYMHEYIKDLERERIKDLENDRITEVDAYLQATGVNDYELTEEDKNILSCQHDKSIHGVRFGKFKATDLFDIKKGKRLTKADMIDGNINFVGSSASNNGVTAKIGNTGYIHPACTFTVSYNGSVGEVFLQDEPFWASDDVNVWYPKFPYNQRFVEYIMTVVRQLKLKYSYTAKWTLDKMQAETLELPITSDGEPDFDYMERYIRAIEKLVIADVVKYKDRVIETTKKVIEG